MAKLTLDAYRTKILRQTFDDIEKAFAFGVEVDGVDPDLDMDKVPGYDDDAKMGGPRAADNRKITKQALCRALGALLNNLTEPQAVAVASVTPDNSTASPAFTDLPGAALSFSQQVANQSVEIRFNTSAFSTGAASAVEFRAVYDGVPTVAYPFFFNSALQHQAFSFAWLIVGAASPGIKNVRIQWRLSFGPGVITQDSNDRWDLLVR